MRTGQACAPTSVQPLGNFGVLILTDQTRFTRNGAGSGLLRLHGAGVLEQWSDASADGDILGDPNGLLVRGCVIQSPGRKNHFGHARRQRPDPLPPISPVMLAAGTPIAECHKKRGSSLWYWLASTQRQCEQSRDGA